MKKCCDIIQGVLFWAGFFCYTNTYIKKVKTVWPRDAKSGGTREPGSQKINWPAESLGPRREIVETITAENSEVFVENDDDYYVTDKVFNINCVCL